MPISARSYKNVEDVILPFRNGSVMEIEKLSLFLLFYLVSYLVEISTGKGLSLGVEVGVVREHPLKRMHRQLRILGSGFFLL